MNDPLGAMSKSLSTANKSIKTTMKKASENFKNNEKIQTSL